MNTEPNQNNAQGVSNSQKVTDMPQPQEEQPPLRIDNAKINVAVRGGENKNTCTEYIFIILSYVLAIVTFPFSLLVCLTTSHVYDRIVILRLGRVKGIKGPGLVFVLPCVDDTFRVDLRTQSFDVHPQEVLTKDSVTIAVDAVVYFKIINPLDAVIRIYNVHESTQLLAQTTLRNVLGTKNLVEVLTGKEVISRQLEKILDEATDPWGVKVERVEIKNIELPTNMQAAMAKEQRAIREAEAKVVAAQGELTASKNLKSASDVMKTNPIAMQLRYLQTINAINNKKSRTIIVPFPRSMIKKYLIRK